MAGLISRDLSGVKIGKRTTLDDQLNKILNAFGEFANVQAAKEEKLLLNVVDGMVRQAGKYNDPAQFKLAYETLNNARENTYGGVADSLLDSYENTLIQEENSYKADIAINEAYQNTKNTLKGLTKENWSSSIEEILGTLDNVAVNFRGDASNAALKLLDELQGDIKYATILSQKLDNADQTKGDKVWDDIGLGVGYKQVRDLLLSGDTSKAMTLSRNLEVKEEDALLEKIGNSYRESVNELQMVAEKYLDTGYHTNYGAGKYSVQDIPASTTGLQNMHPSKLKEVLDEKHALMVRIFNDPEIDWDYSDEGTALKNAFTGKKGTYPGFWATLDNQIFMAGKVSNKRYIDDAIRLKHLQEKVDWVPDRAGFVDDPGAEWLGLGFFTGGADSDEGAKIIYEHMKMYNQLLSGNDAYMKIITR